MSAVDPLYAGIGTRLADARKAAGLSVAAAALEVGWSEARIRSYERADRQVGIDDLITLAGLYGYPVASLLPPDPLVEGEPMVPESAVDRAVERTIAAMRGAFSPLVPVQRAAAAETTGADQ